MGSATTILQNLAPLEFTNPSVEAIFNQMAQGIGDFIDNILTEFVNTQNSILNTINTQRYGKSGYYTTTALNFQYGNNLVPGVGNLDPTYATSDPAAQIISQAAFQNLNGSLSIKVATENSLTGLLQQLTAPQLAAFQNYFVSFEIPGIPVTIVSLPPDSINFNASCTYYAGYDFPTLQANVAAALTAFQNTFVFNGTWYTDQLSAYMLANVPGIVDFFIGSTTINGSPFVGTTSMPAGYFNFASTVLTGITYLSIAE